MGIWNQSVNDNNGVEVTQEGGFIDLQVKIVGMMPQSDRSLIEQRLYTKLKAVGIMIIMMLIVVGIILIAAGKDVVIFGKLEIMIK